MRATCSVVVVLAIASQAGASGLLIPAEKTIPPLAMVHHRVTINIEDQVAVTRLEQAFRNHTNRQLEATYIFPVPRGASVHRFSMWVNGQETKGEMLEAAKAKHIYEDIVRRTQDPGLLEYMGQGLFRVRVFPVEPKADQRISLTFTTVAQKDLSTVEYIYPLKTDGKATATLEDFSVKATIKSQQPIQSIYSPTHAISVSRQGDREAVVQFEKNQYVIDKDFQLFYSLGNQNVGLAMLSHRPIPTDKGFALLLINPRMETSKQQSIARDMIFVLDTSGSMRGAKMDQGKRALRYCIDNLGSEDRFAVLNFSTTVNRYRDGLTEVSPEHKSQARKWVDALECTGGTAIHDALQAAIDLRSSDASRTCTIVFFTDGLPTIGETNPDKILTAVATRHATGMRIFTFGVGYDVNSSMLDRLADQTRAVSTYVKPEEDIEAKVSSLYGKISNPVLTNLKLTTTGDVRFDEVYPPQLPDLFHGGQIIVLARFTGKGKSTMNLTGMSGAEKKEFPFEFEAAEKTSDDRQFVEHLWARRKVGYLLDQIRGTGDKKELVEEVTLLAKKYGIATPYTSYLVVPDGASPVVGGRPVLRLYERGGGIGGGGGVLPFGAPGASATAKPDDVASIAKKAQTNLGDLGANRAKLESEKTDKLNALPQQQSGQAKRFMVELKDADEKRRTYEEARKLLSARRGGETQVGKLGVDLSTDSLALKNQTNITQSAQRQVQGRNCVEYGGIWIDDQFIEKTPHFAIKSQSNAYFRLLALRPEVKEVFQLGNAVVWLTPSGTALVIDPNHGKEEAQDEELTKLFEKK